ncbi:MAG: SH3 domain-containing protein [Ardenticatenaceae bacterium]|nr:SH3 domain-containing protein [Ardenticatenaceae bacterium]
MSSLEFTAAELQTADARIEAFTARFGLPHLYLAYHAAFPVALLPDMVYRIWANFQRDEGDGLLHIPWIAVADLLLSNLCEEVGHELYQMNWAVRDVLLGEMAAHPGLGQPRIRKLADFLERYVDAEMVVTDSNAQRLAQAQRWVSWAYQGRETAVRAAQSIAGSMKQSEGSSLEVARLGSLVNVMKRPLAEAGFENLVAYGQVAWTLVYGDADGRARVVSSDAASSGAQVGDVVLPPPQAQPGPELMPQEAADKAAFYEQGPLDVEEPAPRFIRPFDFLDIIESKLAEPVDEAALAAIDEWRQNPEGERAFLVVGEAGSGKSGLAAHLAQQDWVGAAHFCLADDERTWNWDGLFESLAAQLGNRFGEYGRYLQEVVREREQREQMMQKAMPPLSTSLPDEAEIRLNVKATTLKYDFDLYIREPLARLLADGSVPGMVLVLDGWDVAAVDAPEENVAELLAAMADLPPNVKWVITLRPLPGMVEAIRPLGVREYALTSVMLIHRNYHMQFGSQKDREQLVTQIGRAYSLDELQDLAFEIAIDYENLAGDVKSAKIRTLVETAEFRGQLNRLVTILGEERPQADWVALESKTGVPIYDLFSLHNRITEYFDLFELQDLAFDLAIDYEELPGTGKSDKIRGLIILLARQERLEQLVTKLEVHRPNANWAELSTIGGWAMTDFLLMAEAGDVARVGEAGLNLRSEPRQAADVLGQVKQGSQVAILEEVRGDYVRVSVRQSDLVAGDRVSESVENGLSWEVGERPLHRMIEESFSLDEFEDLCFELGLEYENLSGRTRSAKAIALQQTMMRVGRITDLLAAVSGVRPHLNLRPYLFMILAENYRSDQDMERLFSRFGLPVRDFPEREKLAWGSEGWREEKLKGLQQWVVENSRIDELLQSVQAKGVDLSFYGLPESEIEEPISSPGVAGGEREPAEYKPEWFVNREKKFRGFQNMLEPGTRQRVMLIEAATEMGKTWLLRHLHNYCRAEKIPSAYFGLGEGSMGDVVAVIERALDELGAENFSELQKFMGEYFGIRDGSELRGRTSSEQERQDVLHRVTDLFFEGLERMSGETAVALFFDAYEAGAAVVQQWLAYELVARLAQGRLPRVTVMIAGRQVPELDALKHVVVQTGLETFTEEYVREYLLERRQLADIDVRTVLLTSGGVPGLLAKMADQAMVVDEEDDDFFTNL